MLLRFPGVRDHRRYGTWEAGLILAALAAELLVRTQLGVATFTPALASTAAAALLIGFRRSAIVAVLAGLLSMFVVASPVGSFRLGDTEEWVRLATYCGAAAAVLAVARALERSQSAWLLKQELWVEISRALEEHVDLDARLQAIGDVFVERAADVCVVDVVDDHGQLRRVVATGPSLRDDAKDLGPPKRPSPIYDVLASGKSITHVTEAQVRAQAVDEADFRRRLRLTGTGIVMAPLKVRDTPIGVLTLTRKRPFSEAEIQMVEGLVERAALGIDNARLYDKEHGSAAALQAGLAPGRLTVPDGYEIATRYRAAGDGLRVGGDFYDLFTTSKGAWIAVVGDVLGHGPEAAARTGLVRHTLRAVADADDLSGTLQRVAEAIDADGTEPWFCTLSLTVGWHEEPGRVVHCRGGHPHALLRRADTTVELLTSAGGLLGLGLPVTCAATEIQLQPGDSIIMLTDGIIEARSNGRLFSEEGVIAASRITTQDPEAIVGNIFDQALAHADGDLRDDMAILLIQRTALQ